MSLKQYESHSRDRNKTKVIPACSAVQNFTPHDFEGCCWVPDGNFKLLGAAIGSQGWCEAHLDRRVTRARTLLEVIGRYRDSQGAFALLRSCTGWAKVLYSCRTVPPPLQAAGLCNADRDIRHSLGRLVGSPLSDEDWRLASLGVAAGGVGAVAQWSTHRPLMFPVWLSPKSSVHVSGLVADTESSLLSSFLPNANIYGSSNTPSQRSLSAKIEAKACQHLLDPSSRERHRLAHFSLNRIQGARAWLFGLP